LVQADGGDMRYVFEPRSVAVVGASRNPAKFGHVQLRNSPFGVLSVSFRFLPTVFGRFRLLPSTSKYFEAISCYSTPPIYSWEWLS